LPTHDEFNHWIHFDESFPTLAFSLHPQMGWKTSTAYQPEYVTPMAAACHESQKSKQEKPQWQRLNKLTIPFTKL